MILRAVSKPRSGGRCRCAAIGDSDARRWGIRMLGGGGFGCSAVDKKTSAPPNGLLGSGSGALLLQLAPPSGLLGSGGGAPHLQLAPPSGLFGSGGGAPLLQLAPPSGLFGSGGGAPHLQLAPPSGLLSSGGGAL